MSVLSDGRGPSPSDCRDSRPQRRMWTALVACDFATVVTAGFRALMETSKEEALANGISWESKGSV